MAGATLALALNDKGPWVCGIWFMPHTRQGWWAARWNAEPCGLVLQGLVVTQLDVQPGECVKVKGKIPSDAKG